MQRTGGQPPPACFPHLGCSPIRRLFAVLGQQGNGNFARLHRAAEHYRFPFVHDHPLATGQEARVATGSGNNPQALAHGISVALYNTGFGLLIAIPSMIFYRHFRALVDSLIVEMEQQAVKLVEILHNERS